MKPRNTPKLDRAVRFAGGLCMALALICIGCGPTRAKPVDVELARSTLTKVLEHWKQGGSIDDLRQGRPEIVVQEALWTKDKPLVDYSLVDQGREEDANWYCEVELTFAGANDGKPSKKNVTYVVGTDPVLTVFHAML
ncbi:MAG: hypothetical protein B7Z55_05010 [Planctomycetales bacterium 12-60-4]|nr:MAG: hypothetical protein B7Z55_05010 [Planctomycetales bacterium 12-60-4]